jgi:hypothetical protein
MICYVEPDENENPIEICVTEEQAIEYQKQQANNMDYEYENDQQALDDFIAVNWGYRKVIVGE